MPPARKTLSKPYAANRRHWDAITPVHVASKLYDVEGFVANRTQLPGFMLEELGDLRGKSLLHLHCHFGMDTLRLAMLGAEATGVDFSGAAIKEARKLSRRTGVPAKFVLANVLEPGDRIPGAAYDVVFTSHGAICWLGDLAPWGETIARSLKPGGIFHIFEFHPLIQALAQPAPISRAGALRFGYSYFNPGEPDGEPAGADYADPSFKSEEFNYAWGHSIGEIFGALAGAGLTVTALKEYPFTTNAAREGMVKSTDGFYRLPASVPPLPHKLYIQARKPA